MKQWRWVALRMLLCDLKYLLSVLSKLVYELRKNTEKQEVWVILMAMIGECSLSNHVIGIIVD